MIARSFLLSLGAVIAFATPALALSPHFDNEGVYRFPYGTSTPPTLQCSPDKVCEIILEPGENVYDKVAGDTVRWIIATGVAGAKGETPTIFFKPIDAGSILSPIATNLIVTTNKRTYNVNIVAVSHTDRTRYGFYYPNQDFNVGGTSQVQSPVIPQAGSDDSSRGTLTGGTGSVSSTSDAIIPLKIPMSDSVDSVPPEMYDFGYRISGNQSDRPEIVWNDGAHTYIKMPNRQDTPSMFTILPNGETAYVNVHPPINNVYKIDGTPDHIQLVYGTGKRGSTVDILRGK